MNSIKLPSMLYCQFLFSLTRVASWGQRLCLFLCDPVYNIVLVFTDYLLNKQMNGRKQNIKLHNGIVGYNLCLYLWIDLVSSYTPLNAWKYIFSSSRHKFYRRKLYLIMYRWNRIITQKQQEPPIVLMTEAERSWLSLNSKQLLHAGPWTIIQSW